MHDTVWSDLPSARSSDFKKTGWRGVRERLMDTPGGTLVVTSHQRQEAVLLTTEEFVRLTDLAARATRKEADALEVLRREFDERLASLEAPGAGRKLAAITDQPARLHGRVKAGESY